MRNWIASYRLHGDYLRLFARSAHIHTHTQNRGRRQLVFWGSWRPFGWPAARATVAHHVRAFATSPGGAHRLEFPPAATGGSKRMPANPFRCGLGAQSRDRSLAVRLRRPAMMSRPGHAERRAAQRAVSSLSLIRSLVSRSRSRHCSPNPAPDQTEARPERISEQPVRRTQNGAARKETQTSDGQIDSHYWQTQIAGAIQVLDYFALRRHQTLGGTFEQIDGFARTPSDRYLSKIRIQGEQEA